MSALRAYAVGRAFSSRDADGTDDFAWRQVGFNSDEYTYRRPAPPRQRPQRARQRTASAPVDRRIDPTKIRTREQQKAVARAI